MLFISNFKIRRKSERCQIFFLVSLSTWILVPFYSQTMDGASGYLLVKVF